VTEVHSFLILAGYYRKFIEGFLIALTQKEKEFKWTEVYEKEFSRVEDPVNHSPNTHATRYTQKLCSIL